MTSETKRRAMIFLVLAALITVLLAAALPQLELQKGVPMPKINGGGEGGQGELVPPFSINGITFIETVFGLFFLLVLIYLIVRRRQRLNLKDVLKNLAAIAAISLILAVILYALSNVEINMTPTAVELLPGEVAVITAPELAPVPPSMLWMVWIGLAGLVLLLVMGMARVRIQKRVVRDPLALEAEQAVEALKAGQDLSNVIIRCYQQMSQVLKKEQGLTLEETMTAREFEALLEKRGVPNAPVRQLTRLFEIARYAPQMPGPAEESQAIDSLNAIAQYSQKKGSGQRI